MAKEAVLDSNPGAAGGRITLMHATAVRIADRVDWRPSRKKARMSQGIGLNSATHECEDGPEVEQARVAQTS
jgi:hypothetical protein